MKLLTDEEADRLINDEDIKHDAITRVEENGIVFLDEIDKIVGNSHSHGPDVVARRCSARPVAAD